MEKITKIALWSLGGLVVVGTGVVLIPKLLNKTAEKTDEESPDETVVNNVGTTYNQPVNPIGSAADVKKFQDWMDVKHPNWLKTGKSLNKGAGYGNFGSQTSTAWAKYAEEYQKGGVAPAAVVKTYKAYSAKSGNPIYNNAGDLMPFRLAGNSELLGTLTGVIKKDYAGTPYAEFKQPDGKNRYALYNTVKLTQ